MQELKWYQLNIQETFKKLNSNEKGLTSSEVEKRRVQYGYNELKFKKPSALMRFLRQFNNSLVYILIAAATITGILTATGKDMLADTIVIVGVVILNAILGFFQEGKAEGALEALQKMIVSECTVLRDGKQIILPTRELVPGDIVTLNGGDKIPADLRLINTKEAEADEASLTGESTPVKKNTDAIARSNLSPGDQRCIAFSGTFIAKGSAKGIVIGTAESTEFGKIATLVKTTKNVLTPLQKKITDFTKILIISILAVGCVNLILSKLFGYTLIYSFLASVSLIVAAIPEMLPMLVTAILALAASIMAKRHALIRRLPAAETLGCTTVICSDKTGTLTKNEMTVCRIYSGNNFYYVTGVGYEPKGDFLLNNNKINPTDLNKELIETLKAGLFCNTSELNKIDDMYKILGDPTEGALLVSSYKANINAKTENLDELPFDSERMYMATLHKGEENNIIYLKGSPEKVLNLCKDQIVNNKNEQLNTDQILNKANEMAGDALRLLGMAYKVVSKEKTSITDSDIKDMTFVGIQGMIDPPREEAIEAIAKCKTAGIRTVMITGDHVATAKAIAKQLGIISTNNHPALIGEQLEKMTDKELYDVVDNVSVYARVAPEHKLRIAQQLQKHGHIIAMTGDGVNDAPALKAADIGIAMGITGTEVSKEASSMILTDDNFASIVNAVEEGRHAWKNLERAILYTLPTNAGQALLVMGAVLLAPFIAIFAARLPLEPVQILWVNLFDSVFLTMPLMMEMKNKDLLTSAPRDPKAGIANSLFFQRVGIIGVIIATCGFVIYHHFGAAAVSATGKILDPHLLTQAQTAAFWAVLMVHFGFVMSARTVNRSAFTYSPFSNKWLLAGIVISVLTRLLPTFVPAVSAIFRTEDFPMEWWLYIFPCLFPGFIALEIDKLIRKKVKARKARIQQKA